MTLGEKIRELRKEKGYSLRKLAELTNSASHSYISSIERNEYEPSLKIIRDIAHALEVPTAYLLDIYDQDRTENYNKFILKQGGENKLNENVSVVRIPIIGDISGGRPILAEEQIQGYKQMPKESVGEGVHFILEVTGDSMINAGIYEGDLVLIKQQPTCETGEICAVLIDNENATLKRVYPESDRILLQSDNPKYKPLIVKSDEVDIIGKAVQVIRDL